MASCQKYNNYNYKYDYSRQTQSNKVEWGHGWGNWWANSPERIGCSEP